MLRLPAARRLPRLVEIAAWVLASRWHVAGLAPQKRSRRQPTDKRGLLDFFETKVRPLLADNCFECHSGKSKALQGGLRLDSRASMLTGGESAEAVVVPGKPNDSPLVHAIRWETSEMPPRGKLREDQIAVLVKWIEMGGSLARRPNPAAAPALEKTTVYDWNALRARHWAWQPIREPRRLPPDQEQLLAAK